MSADTTGWGVSPRGAGYLFGSDVVAQFNASNDIDMICRAHQLVMEGYKWHFNETVLTVWSAPNYCYRSAARQAHAKHTLRGWEGGEARRWEGRNVTGGGCWWHRNGNVLLVWWVWD